ncbi:transposase [Asaia siamensis]
MEIDILPEQDTDIRQAEPMLENIDPDVFLPNRAYDADRLIDRLKERGIAVIIPPNATEQPSGKQTSLFTGERNLGERFFDRSRRFRAIATRYDKLKSTVLAAAQLAPVIILPN